MAMAVRGDAQTPIRRANGLHRNEKRKAPISPSLARSDIVPIFHAMAIDCFD